MSIDESSVLEALPVPRPAADTVAGPPADWLAAVTGRTSRAPSQTEGRRQTTDRSAAERAE